MSAETGRSLFHSLTNFSGDYLAFRHLEEEAVGIARALPEAEQMVFVIAALEALSDQAQGQNLPLLSKPLSAVLRRKLPFTPEQILQFVELGREASYYFPFGQIIRLAGTIPMTPELRTALQNMSQARVVRNGQVSGTKQIEEAIEELVAIKGSRPVGLEVHGPWSETLQYVAEGLWLEVLQSGREITGSEPSKKWREAARQRVSAIGEAAFQETALEWLALGPSPKVRDLPVDGKEADYQRGLLWHLTGYSDSATAAAVARFGESCLRKIPMIGAVCHKSANACVKVLASMPGMNAIGQLSRLSTKVKYSTAQRLVLEALEEAAAKQGLSPEELEEITLPTFGLDASGTRSEQLDEVTATVTSAGGLSFHNADGKVLKSVPESIKSRFADEVKDLKTAAKEVGAMKAAQRIRVERLLLSQRWIPFSTWVSAYLEHPLVSDLATRLIWQAPSGETLTAHQGQLLDWSSNEVENPEKVRLWHPLGSDVQTVLSWRCWLEDRGIQQPFKQAHREVYVLTDAERETATYSNRFAGHVLKQHPFKALCTERRWKFNLMGEWDSHNTPTLELAPQNLRVTYGVDFPQDTATSHHAVYLYISTGELTFHDRTTGEALALESIPAHVFSEVLRDVDLFVGVCSIGADPTWLQQEPQSPFAEYWGLMNFGELSMSAKIRREILQQLVPRLTISDRLRLDERFLWVKGNRGQYRIHLGSGSVQIEPGSRYLCIVQGPSAGKVPGSVFLPFEGDHMLSVILSKAFLLAADTRITDKSILSQLP